METEVKDESIPIIYPSSYLPAYPGSYWHYNFNHTGPISYSIKTEPGYIVDSVNTESFTTPKYIRARVPVYNGQPLWGLKTHSYIHSGNNGLSWSIILKDSAVVRGQELAADWSKQTGRTSYRITLINDTSLSINGKTYNHVIATRDYLDWGGGQILLGNNADKYYAKDVGLIAQYGYNYNYGRSMKPTLILPMDGVVASMELVSFFINK